MTMYIARTYSNPAWLTSAFTGLHVEYSPQSPEVDGVGVKGKRKELPRVFSW